jgi:invasion protein IalB
MKTRSFCAKTCLLLLLSLLLSAVCAREGRDNKLVEFKRSGAWEVWCIAQQGSGLVVCDLNQVLRYKPHPDFRAMIPRLFVDDSGLRLEIETERQTSLQRGYIQVDENPPVSLSECGKPCRMRGPILDRLAGQLGNGVDATIRFHDHRVERFDVPLDLEGFSEGLSALRGMQARFYSVTSASPTAAAGY